MNLSPTHIAIIVALALIGAGISIYRSRVAARRRRDELADLAASLGWTFTPDDDSSHDNQFAQFAVFRRGHSRAALNTIEGTLTIDGLPYPCRMGDYSYQETSSDSDGHSTTTTYRFSYLILRLPFPGVPSLLIRREGILDRLKGALGFEDIDFESEAFSRRYFVSSSDRRFAYDVIHPRMMEWLMAVDPPAIDIERGALCLTDGASRWTPDTFRRQMAIAAQFFDRWPDHLAADLRAPAA